MPPIQRHIHQIMLSLLIMYEYFAPMLKRYFIFPPLHVFFFATISYMCGIIYAWQFSSSLQIMWAVVFATIIAFYFWQRKFIFLYQVSIVACFFFLGIFLYTLAQTKYHRFHTTLPKEHICIKGKIVSIESVTHDRFAQKIGFHITHVRNAEPKQRWQTISGTILVYCYDSTYLQPDDLIQINDICLKPILDEKMQQYFLRDGFFATLFVKRSDIRLLYRPIRSYKRILYAVKKSIYQSLQQKINPHTFELVSSIFFGLRLQTDHYKENAHSFKLWGISHYLARSGLHVVIFILLWQFFLSFLPINQRSRQIILLLLILLYSFLSWSSVSFDRAILMFFLMKTGSWLEYATHYLHIISLATCIILLYNPFHLFFLDFQLSFGFTLGLAWFGYVESQKNRKIINS